MSPKIKMFLIYAASFFVIYVLVYAAMTAFVEKITSLMVLIPVVVAYVFSFKPYIEESQSGRRYGLKHLFVKKIWYLD